MESMGVVVRRYIDFLILLIPTTLVYRFPHITYPYYSCICSFGQQHPYFFVHVLECFLYHRVGRLYK